MNIPPCLPARPQMPLFQAFSSPNLLVQNAEKIPTIMGSSDGLRQQSQFQQNVFVARHGDRIDYIDPLWSASAARPWDPPLIEQGKARALQTGWRIRRQIDFPIHRVFVSPFLRCLQTANGMITALTAVGDGSSDTVAELPKVKVSIELGLCEMLNSTAIKPDVAPKDGIFPFDISKCEAEFSSGVVDHTVEPVYKMLPNWEETSEAARARYQDIVEALANKYPKENLLLVTHGEGVASSVYKFVKDVHLINEVEYCAYSHFSRPIIFREDGTFTVGDLVGFPEGQFGVKYI